MYFMGYKILTIIQYPLSRSSSNSISANRYGEKLNLDYTINVTLPSKIYLLNTALSRETAILLLLRMKPRRPYFQLTSRVTYDSVCILKKVYERTCY